MVFQTDKDAVEIPSILPLMPVRDIVIYSYMFLPLFVGRESSIRAVETAMEKDRLILLATQKDPANDKPTPGEIYEIGTVAMVMKKLKLPDNRIKILVQGLMKARIKRFVQEDPLFLVEIEKIEEPAAAEITVEIEALIRNVKEQCEKILSLKGLVSPEVMEVLENVNDPGRLADLVAVGDQDDIVLGQPVARGVLEVRVAAAEAIKHRQQARGRLGARLGAVQKRQAAADPILGGWLSHRRLLV